jgi:AraC-like DNA-binding protein
LFQIAFSGRPEISAVFDVLSGDLTRAIGPRLGPAGGVILSNLTAGASTTSPRSASSIKYVASGLEIYRYGGKTFTVSAGQFLVVPEHIPGEVEVKSTDASSTWGLCLLLEQPATPSAAPVHLEEPMIFPAGCSHLGRMLSSSLLAMKNARFQREAIATDLLAKVNEKLEPCLADAAGILEQMEFTKASTRYETLRRLQRARAYLHSVVDRTVGLGELAEVSRISRFRLVRQFKQAFGLPPTAYHTALRLDLAREQLTRRLNSCGAVAHQFGFADGSSFSHAYRRKFGVAPSRQL